MTNNDLQLDRLADEFELACQQGGRPSVSKFLDRVDDPLRHRLAELLIPIDAEYRLRAGEMVTSEEYSELGPLFKSVISNCLQSVLSASDFHPFAPQNSAPGRPSASGMSSQTIGPYRLVQLLGAGGMGEVWIAEQNQPVKRQVALKLIRSGLRTKEILARFEGERQALSLMNHPNIARILDAGTTDEGQPYFAMELVQGQTLITYCDQQRLSIEERLLLFIDVCSGVQHAHQKGIIHRDLKPANILVTVADGVPIPKVIDFGLAKAMENTHRLHDQSLYTEMGQILGTLKYMSPEQAKLDSNDIDTRADIYALGVILYELLAGTTPLNEESIKGMELLQLLEMIREKEPIKPSSRLNHKTPLSFTITDARRTDRSSLRKILLGDLDWVVMKALEKDRARRYDSVSSFATDVRRFLQNEPVIARPPSLNYRLRKFVRKNRAGVLAASLVLISLLGGLVTTTVQMRRAQGAERLADMRRGEADQARDLAEQRRKSAEAAQEKALAAAQAERIAREEEERQRGYAQAITNFVKSDFLALTSIEGQYEFGNASDQATSFPLSKDSTLRELLDRAAEKLDTRTDLAPQAEAELRQMIGFSYRGLGDAKLGLPFLEQSVKLFEQIHGKDAEQTLAAAGDLAVTFNVAGQFDRGIPLLEQTVESKKAKFGPDHPSTLTSIHHLAIGHYEVGHLEKALLLWESVLESRRQTLGPGHKDTLTSMSHLAAGYRFAGQLEKSLPLLVEALALQTAQLGKDHPDSIASMGILAGYYRAAGQFDRAVSLFEDALELTKGKYGVDHTNTFVCMNNLAACYRSSRRPDMAIPLLEQAYDLQAAKIGSDHPNTLTTMNNLAGGYREAGMLEKALPLFEEILIMRRTKLGPEHPDTLTSINNLAGGYYTMGDIEKARPLFEESLRLNQEKFGPSHPRTLVSLSNLAMVYQDAAQIEDALALFEQAAREIEKRQFRHEQASTIIPNTIDAYIVAEKFEQAELWQKKWLEFVRSDDGPESSAYAGELAGLGSILLQRKAWQVAETVLRECLSIRENIEPERWSTFNTCSMLGAALLGQQRFDDAEPLLLRGYRGMKDQLDALPPQVHVRVTEAIDRIIELYATSNLQDELTKWTEEKESLRSVLQSSSKQSGSP